LADPYNVVRNVIEKLRESVKVFDNEVITTNHLDIWSTKKLVALYIYIGSYLKIMRNNNFKKIHYVDLFSGSGLVNIQGKIMPGSPLIPLIRDKDGLSFYDYFFADSKKTYIKELRERSTKLYGEKNLRIENYDFDTSVRHLFSGRWPMNYHDNAYLVMVDPFGMEVSWDMLIRILGSGSVDMFLTFMTWGFQRNRSLPHSAQTMTNVFGNEDWKNREEDLVTLYRQQIEALRLGNNKPYQTGVLAVANAKGATYHLIFVSTSEKGAHGTFEWIQRHVDAVDLDLLNDAFRGATMPGSDLNFYMKSKS